MMLLDRYPKTVNLQDKTQVTLRAMTKQDERTLMDFFESLNEEDRLYLRNDVSSYRVVREWFINLNYKRVFPLLAIADGRIIANATLHRKPYGWMRHMGEIRIVVSPEFRKMGLARLMASEIIAQATEAGLQKLTAEMAASQKNALEVFHRLGFKDEAVLKGYVRDGNDDVHDLLILTREL